MTPVEQAKAVYDREECARSFREDFEAHLLGGYVTSTPEYFAMARPVIRAADAADIVNPWVTFDREDCDAWLIYLAAGDLAQLIAAPPFHLPWIGWERDNVLRWRDLTRLQRMQARFADSDSDSDSD